AVLPVQHLVADLHIHRDALVLLEPARAHGNDLALLRLLLRGIGDIQTAAHLLRLLERTDNDAVRQRVDLHTGLGGHTVCSSLLWLRLQRVDEKMNLSTLVWRVLAMDSTGGWKPSQAENRRTDL